MAYSQLHRYIPVLLLGTLTSLPMLASAETAAEEAARKAKRAQEEVAKYTQQCTFKGEVSQICVRLEVTYRDRQRAYKETDYNTTDFPRFVEAVRACFSSAYWKGEGRKADTSDAEKLLGQALPEHPLLTECFRVTDKMNGTGWRAGVEALLKNTAFVKTVAAKVAADFKKKCGTGARVEEGGTVQLVLEKKSAKKSVFYTGKNPAGHTLTILCNGRVNTKYADGGSSSTEARTEEGVDTDNAESMCMLNCARTNIHCSGTNVTDPACDRACRPKCTKK